MKANFLVVSILVIGVLASGAARAQLPGAQKVVDSLRLRYHLPALCAAVIEAGRIRYVYAGVKRNDRPEPVVPSDYFHLGSDTKGVTSLLAGKLVEQGKISWDSKLVDVVPALRGHVLPAYTGVTLSELLSHRAGIRPYTAGSDYEHLPAFSGPVSAQRLQFATVILQETPVVPSGSVPYVYSNAGYVLAALMLEQASGRSWEELVKRAFRHLRLPYRLGFPNRQDPRQPWGHWLPTPADSVLTPLGPTHDYALQGFMAPAGDLAMPLPAFARLLQLHLNGLLGHGNYVSASTYQRLHFGQPAYAYGWAVSTEAATGALVSLHNGSAGTFFCQAVLFPGRQVAFAVVANAGGPAAEQACTELRRQLKKLYLQAAQKRMSKS